MHLREVEREDAARCERRRRRADVERVPAQELDRLALRTVAAAGISWFQRLCRTREKPSTVVTGPAGGSTTGMTTSGLPTPGAGTPSCAAASVPPTPAMAAAAAVPTENCWMKFRRDME